MHRQVQAMIMVRQSTDQLQSEIHLQSDHYNPFLQSLQSLIARMMFLSGTSATFDDSSEPLESYLKDIRRLIELKREPE